MSFLRKALRMRVYASIAGMGFARTADSVDVDGIVDAGKFLDGDAGEGNFAGGWQYRPGQTDPNRVKVGAGIDGDKWTTAQAPYSGGSLSDLAYEGLGLLHPDILNECFRLALHEIFFETYYPLGWAMDNDFGTTNGYDWDGNATDAGTEKVATGGLYSQNGQSGYRNLKVTTTGANGNVHASSLFVSPGDVLFHGAIARAFDGDSTGAYRLWDATNDAELESVEFTSRAFLKYQFATVIPVGCNEVYQILEGVENGAVVEWDCLFGHLIGAEQRQLIVPSWLTERWRFLGFGPAEYGREVDDGVFNASSRKMLEWKPATGSLEGDFALYPLTEEADPFIIQVNRPAGLGERDYWIHGLRPYSDITELADEEQTTNAPEELLMAAVYFRVYSALHMDAKDNQGNSEWMQLRDEAWQELKRRRQFGAVADGPPQPVAPPQPAIAAT